MANSNIIEADATAANLPIGQSGSGKVDGLREHHPLFPLLGKYKDDPTWDEFMENIQDYRRADDAHKCSGGLYLQRR